MQIIITLLIISTFLIVPSTSNSPIYWNATNSAGTFTEDSPYYASLTKAFSDLVSLASSKPFANVTVGSSESSRVYALFSCQHDLPPLTCHSCVENATLEIFDLFDPYPKEAIIIYKECMLRHSNRMIFSSMESEPYYNECGTRRYPSYITRIEYWVQLASLTLIDQAINSTDYFAVGGLKNVVGDDNLYFLVQCTPDITKKQCNDCLSRALNITVASCGSDARMGGYTMGPSCILRYNYESFFYDKVALKADVGAPPTPASMEKKKDGPWVVFGKVGLSIILVLLSFLLFVMLRRLCCRR